MFPILEATLIVLMALVAIISLVVCASARRTSGWLVALGALLFVAGLSAMAMTGYDASHGSQITFAVPSSITTTFMAIGATLIVVGLLIGLRDLRRGGHNEVPPESEHQEVMPEQIAGEGTPAIFRS